MDANTRHAISIGRIPTYFKSVVSAIEYAKAQAETTGKVHGVHRTGNRVNKFMVREGFHQGVGNTACAYVAHPQNPRKWKGEDDLGMDPRPYSDPLD